VAKLIEYDVSGVEESSGGTGVKVKPGVHPARIVRCSKREEKKDGTPANDIEVALDFGEEFDWGFTYIGLSEAADWKLAEFVRALGLKEKGKLDPEKQIGKVIRVKVNSGSYDGVYSPDIGRLMKAQPGDEDLIGQSVSEMSSNGAGAAGPDADDVEPDADAPTYYREGEPDPEDADAIVGSYDDWPDSDLEAEVADRSLTLPGGRGSKKNKMIAALRADDEEWKAAGGAEPADEAEPAADGDAQDDYDEWDTDKLKEEWGDRGLGDVPVIRGSNAEGRLRDKIIKALREDDEANPFES
jgi:hypothetical protein